MQQQSYKFTLLHMSETTERKPDEDGQPQQEKRGVKEEPVAAAGEEDGAPPAGRGAAAAPPPVHEPAAPPKRAARTPPQSAPKRATRASTGAPIALTAKGSLYKANKDTGERPQRGRRARRWCDRVWGFFKNDERLSVSRERGLQFTLAASCPVFIQRIGSGMRGLIRRRRESAGGRDC